MRILRKTIGALACFLFFAAASEAQQLYVGYAGSGEIEDLSSKPNFLIQCVWNEQTGERLCKNDGLSTLLDYFTGLYKNQEVAYFLYSQPLLSNVDDSPITGFFNSQRTFPVSSWAPSLASFNGRMYMAYKDFDTDKIRIGSTAVPHVQGAIWNNGASFPQIKNFLSSAKPHLQVFGGRLYITFKGSGSEYIYISSTSDGVTWTDARTLGASQTANPPSMAVLGNKLFIFYRGRSSQYMYAQSTYDGITWTAPTYINNHETSHTPYAAEFNGKLYLAFKGRSSEYVYITSSYNGVNWTPASIIPNLLSDRGPALASYNGELYMIFRGRSSKRVWYTKSVDGVNWTPAAIKANTRTSGSLSAAVF